MLFCDIFGLSFELDVEALVDKIAVVEASKSNFDWWGRICYLATGLLFAFAFPCCEIAEFAYFFAVPFLVWGYGCGNKRILGWSAFAAGLMGWFLILFFLRHVWIGFPLVTGAYGGLYVGVWLYVACMGLRVLVEKKGIVRVVGFLGLAGFWVILEWLRGWLFSGFPWLPLAASQWQKPVVLQLLPWTGAYGLSFVLIFFNLVIASFIIELRRRMQMADIGDKSLGSKGLIFGEMYVGLGMMVVAIVLFLKTKPESQNQEYAFKVGVVQTNIEPRLKWDASFFWENMRVLKDETLQLKEKKPDLIIWPEAAIPTALNADLYMLPWMKELVEDVGVPFLIGGIASERGNEWYNAIFEIRPGTGLSANYYAKQKRVPFGEYVPFRKYLPFVDKVVPTEFDISPGMRKDPLVVEANGRPWKIGGLVCYEDIFAFLARESVRRGADFLLVITNDGWYRGEGGAYQHASNSVLRAVECRRPVIRCGNDGWSGWIDEFGNMRGVLVNGLGRIFMRGGGVFPVYYDKTWAGKETFYVKYGDWFVGVAGLLMIGMFVILLKRRKDEVSI